MKSDDLISRKAAIDLWDKYHPYIATKAIAYDRELRALPSAQPRQKTGKWLDSPITAHSLAKHCSRCGYVCLGYDSITGARFQYCPSCGAKMLKEGERIDS